MKTHLPLVVLCGLISSGFAVEAPAPITAARITSPLSDGTPPAPEPEKPKLIVRPENIVSSETHEQGGRQITLRQITPIDLPPPPEAPAPVEVTPAMRALWDQRRAQFPRQELVRLGATVHRSKSAPTRSHVTLWQADENPDDSISSSPVVFWSSADFALLTSFATFQGNDGKSRSLLMTWSERDDNRISAWLSKNGTVYQAPKSPELPTGPATFKVISGQPTPATLSTIQSLHDLYNTEQPRLQAAHDSRQQAQRLAAAQAKANPPQPKNLILNYWHLPSTPAAQEGGTK